MRFAVWILIAASLPLDARVLDVTAINESPPESFVGSLEDAGGALTYEQVRAMPETAWVQSRANDLNFGITSSAIWARLDLTSRTPRDLYLIIRAPLLGRVTLFEGERVRELGAEKPFSSREIFHRYFIFPIHIEKQTTLYLRVQTKGLVGIPVRIMTPAAFAQSDWIETLLLGIYYGTMLCMLVYNLFVLVIIRERSYVSYLLYVSAGTVYALSTNGLAFEFLWPNTPALTYRFNGPWVCLYIALSLQFTRSFLQTVTTAPWLNRWIEFSGIIALASSLSFLLVEPQTTGKIAAAMATPCLLTMLIAGIRVMMSGFRPARLFTLAVVVYVIGGIVFTFRNWGYLPANNMTLYGIQFGGMIQAVVFSLALADRVQVLRSNLKKHVEELETMKAAIELSEQKYRKLVEDTQDIIFSLDRHFAFLTVNRAIGSHLGYSPKKIIGQRLQDITYTARSWKGELLTFQLKELETRGHTEFRQAFKTSLGESRDLQVRLELLRDDGTILGKAQSPADDPLQAFFYSERTRYYVDNLISTSELASHRISRNLRRYCSEEDSQQIKMAVREMVLNAVEHGNLEIDFDTKTRAMAQGAYFDLLLARQRDPAYAGRKVKVDVSLNPNRVIFQVEDEGRGFDHESAKARADQANEERLEHGRGIKMTLAIFDLVQYNTRGNRVTLVKFFH